MEKQVFSPIQESKKKIQNSFAKKVREMMRKSVKFGSLLALIVGADNANAQIHKENKVPTLIVHDRANPQLHAYKDSLSLYNFTVLQEKFDHAAAKNGYGDFERKEPYNEAVFGKNEHENREKYLQSFEEERKKTIQRYEGLYKEGKMTKADFDANVADANLSYRPDSSDIELWKVGDKLISQDSHFYWDNPSGSPDLKHKKIKPIEEEIIGRHGGWNLVYKKPVRKVEYKKEEWKNPIENINRLPLSGLQENEYLIKPEEVPLKAINLPEIPDNGLFIRIKTFDPKLKNLATPRVIKFIDEKERQDWIKANASHIQKLGEAGTEYLDTDTIPSNK